MRLSSLHRFGLRRRLASESGFAVPTVMFMILGAFAIASVAVIASIDTQRGGVRDQESKTGLAAAEAGVSRALLHYNRVPTSGGATCLVPGAGGQIVATAPQADGWCLPVTAQIASGTFTYQVRPTSGALEVVSTGNVAGVTRRVNVAFKSSSGQAIFANASVLAQDRLTLNSNAQVRANVGTNGSIELRSNAWLCGDAAVGIDGSLTLVGGSSRYYHADCAAPTRSTSDVTKESMVLPPVNQGDVATNNDNWRFFTHDPISGNKSDVTWSASSRRLTINGNSAVTLGGSKYSLCTLSMDSNTNLFVPAGSNVRIYFDSPENCNLPAGAVQLQMDSNSRITSVGGGPSNVQLLFVGSPTRATTINLNSNTQVSGACEQNFVIYAPLSNIVLDSNATYCGALAGKTIHADSNAVIYSDDGSRNFTLPDTASHYVFDRFVECSAAPASPPNQGC